MTRILRCWLDELEAQLYKQKPARKNRARTNPMRREHLTPEPRNSVAVVIACDDYVIDVDVTVARDNGWMLRKAIVEQVLSREALSGFWLPCDWESE